MDTQRQQKNHSILVEVIIITSHQAPLNIFDVGLYEPVIHRTTTASCRSGHLQSVLFYDVITFVNAWQLSEVVQWVIFTLIV